jgi:hypothetical protein
MVKTAESGPPSPELMGAIGKLAQELGQSGVLMEMGGLLPSARGARMRLSRGGISVTDGPFTESKELVGGFYIIEVDTQEEAIEWALRCPTGLGFDDVLEIRTLTGESDLPPHLLDLIYKAAPTWSATFSKKR